MSSPKQYGKFDDTVLSVYQGINLFSTDFFKAVIKNEKKNLVCSPVSCSVVLSMIGFGARGVTEKEILSVLQLPSDYQALTEAFRSLIYVLDSVSRVNLCMANGIFMHFDSHIAPEFTSLIKHVYRSVAQTVNFRDLEATAEIINDWGKARTNGIIENVILPNQITSDTGLVLVNALWFKGKWKTQFNAAETIKRDFYTIDKKKKRVPTMFKKARFNSHELLSVRARCVELPYKSADENDAMSMFIIIPAEIDGLNDIEENLHTIDFKNLHDRDTNELVELYLPKFKIESSISLNENLENMGLKEIFKSTADFSGISNAKPFYVQSVIQKVFLEVDEIGSQASAITVTASLIHQNTPIQPREIRADRPFFCALVLTKIGMPVFCARVMDPCSSMGDC